MIKYVSRGESYSTWKFYQRNSDRHRGHLTEVEDAKRIGCNQITLRSLRSLSFVEDNFRCPSKESKDIIPLTTSRHERIAMRAGNMESSQSKFESELEKREDNSILSFNPISASLEYPNTPIVDVPRGVLFTQYPLILPSPPSLPPPSLSLSLSLSHSTSLFLRFFIVSFAPSVCSSSSKVRILNL